MRRCLTHALVAVAMTTPVPAFAQDAKCPPGAWFCEEVEPPRNPTSAEPPPAAEPSDVTGAEALPSPPPPPPPRRPAAGRGAPPVGAPPPVVVYQTSLTNPPTQIVIVTPGAAPPPRVIVRTAVPAAPPPPPPPKRRWHPQWGLNLRLEGVSMGGRDSRPDDDAGMGGVGFSLRYRPVPAFAIDAGVDILAGTDYNGFDRTEVPLSLSGLLFVNPRSRVQFYLMGGIHISHADVEVKPTAMSSEDNYEFVPNTEYEYFGGQGGIGLEFRLSRRVALNIDALGFIRKRTDEGTTPEFTDPDTGRTTNTSGGGLFRGGLSIYW
jgi:hypothetical protein